MCVYIYEYNMTLYKDLSLHNCESWLKFIIWDYCLLYWGSMPKRLSFGKVQDSEDRLESKRISWNTWNKDGRKPLSVSRCL